MGSRRFHNLDAMRGICALSIVLFHSDGLFRTGEVFCHGFLAVDMFFILSGFVLAHTYEARLEQGMTTAAFGRARLKRLAPVYWAGTLLGALMLIAVARFHDFYTPLQIAGLSALAMAVVPQLTLGGLAYPANPVAWSLLGELIANLIYARWLAKWRTRHLGLIVALGWAASAAAGYANGRGWCFGATAQTVLLTPVRAIPGFLAGVVVFRLYRRGVFARVPAVSPLVPLLVWTVIAQVPTFGATPTFDMLVVTLVCPLLLVLLVRAPERSPKPLLWLGAISYPLYASHLAVLMTARYTPWFGLDRGADFLQASFMLATAIAIAWAIHRVVERPWPRARPVNAAA